MFITFSIPNQCFTILSADDLISSKYLYPFFQKYQRFGCRIHLLALCPARTKGCLFFLWYSYRRKPHKSYQIMCLFLHIYLFYSAVPLPDAPFPFASFPPLTSQSPGSHASLDTFSSSQSCFHSDIGPMANQCRPAITKRVFPPPPLPQQQWS